MKPVDTTGGGAKPLKMSASLSRIDQFAEHLANGKSVSDAASLLGVSQQRGSALLRQIKEGLGRQAYG